MKPEKYNKWENAWLKDAYKTSAKFKATIIILRATVIIVQPAV